LRTGNANAEEWARWERETSIENLDVLEKLGVTTAHLPCTKGFGFEYEKPLIERAAKFAEAAAKRGIKTDVYVQGFPIYYETFLVETPQAVNWLARDQDGRFIPWGNQTFRRWVDPTCVEFLEYQRKMFTYILSMIRPHHFMMDNTQVAATYTDSSRASWRKYLEDKFTPDEAYREFGIKSFKAIDLPVFDPIYYPIDAFNIVKDPIMQEWTFWRAQITDNFLTSMRDHIKSIAPEVQFHSPSGCEGLRYNQFFRAGINYEARIDILDDTHMEESGWRPGIIESKTRQDLNIVMDERSPDVAKVAEKSSVRVSTDSRWGKIMHNYNKHGAVQFFWGETTRETKLKALAHGFCFSQHPNEIGSIGPLCADSRMGDDTRDVFDWGNQHIGILTNREKRFSPVAVWRSTNTNAFIRHRPVWEACVTEQILYENHIPFDIILDNGLERFLEGRKLLILPGASCISQKQIELITAFVEKGGNLLILGAAGTRDERTRVRTKHAFAHLLGTAMPNLEQLGPPHWVPTLDFSKMPETISATFGKGKVSLIKKIEEIAPLNLTRDVYMPERQVFVEDIVPPKNEALIMEHIYALYGKDSLQIDGPRWSLTEYWKQGKDLLICCANLRQRYDGGPITIKLGGCIGNTIELHTLLKSGVENIPVINGIAIIKSFEHFCALTVRGYF
jgi:hypothetical protein